MGTSAALPIRLLTGLLVLGSIALGGVGCAPADDISASVQEQREHPKGEQDRKGPYYVGPEAVGQPWGETGLRQFRGNTTHTFYGAGPVPVDPQVKWRFPDEAMCSESSVYGKPKTWCGSGWTGQPAVWQRPDGITEIIVGTYDRAVHFINAETGERTRPDFPTGDIIKGSVTIDPDGYPLLYFGSRDNKLRILALDREVPTELWALDANVVPIVWNNDWDGNPSIVNDVLFEGGENSWFFAVKLNREVATNPSTGVSEVTVSPNIIFQTPGYTDELIDRVGRNVSIENSVAVYDDRVYFANSGGRIVGLDITDLDDGEAPIVFDLWVGEDVDASIVVDEEGMLYVGVEYENGTERGKEIGQLIKVNPYVAVDDPFRSTAPIVWSVDVPAASADDDGGIWATPALYGDYVYATTHPGELLVVDRFSGEVVTREYLAWHAWSSPLVVDGQLVIGMCTGELRTYDLADPAAPTLRSSTKLESGACIESTPALFGGKIVVGARDGFIYAFGD
jgi:hypothetical protein